VERLFEVLLHHYGKRFVDQWGQVDPQALKAHWAQQLGSLSEAELRRGLKRLDQCAWPPSLPEFKALCRAAQDYEAAFFEAVRESQRRRDGLDEWSEPAVFWAAVRMGRDLHSRPYEQLRLRWREALDSAVEDIRSGRLADEVPPARAPRLPPRPQAPSAEGLAAAEEALEAMRAALRRQGPSG
jgi:cation transport regulator ChaB